LSGRLEERLGRSPSSAGDVAVPERDQHVTPTHKLPARRLVGGCPVFERGEVHRGGFAAVGSQLEEALEFFPRGGGEFLESRVLVVSHRQHDFQARLLMTVIRLIEHAPDDQPVGAFRELRDDREPDLGSRRGKELPDAANLASQNLVEGQVVLERAMPGDPDPDPEWNLTARRVSLGGVRLDRRRRVRGEIHHICIRHAAAERISFLTANGPRSSVDRPREASVPDFRSDSSATAPRVFISYRREEASAHAGRLADVLIARFGSDRVFMDIDAIDPGLDFRLVIEEAIESCDAVLVVIGPRWLTVTGEDGSRRLDNPDDYVRLEIEAALERGVRVIPVLVDGMLMPPANELPGKLAPLSFRNAVEVGKHFHRDVGILVDALERLATRGQGGGERPRAEPKGLGIKTREASGLSPAAERKVVTVVFSDLVGSTDLGESLDPEPLRQVLSRYFGAMREILERHGGKVEKYIGDAVMAVFGLPTVREDDALRAVRASAEMREALKTLNAELEGTWGVRLETRTGVNTGRVVTGDSGHSQGFVTGDAVNVAARLEQAAGTGEIVIGPVTRQLVGDAAEVTELAPLELKGKSDRVRAFRLDRILVEPPSQTTETALVGREGELRALLDAFGRAWTTPSIEAIVVWGDAGIGKTRLIEEVIRRALPEWSVLRGRVPAEGEGMTFRPLAEIVEQAASIDPADPVEEALHKISRLLEGTSEAQQATARIAGTIGLSEPAEIADSVWAFRLLFENMARREPVLLVFDDLQWAEPGMLRVLRELLEGRSDQPLMLLAGSRPEAREAAPFLSALPAVHLAPLGAPGVDRLLEELSRRFGLAEIPAGVRASAGGNPLFLGEYARLLGEAQGEPGDEPSVPPTIDALLSARIAQLSEAEQRLLQRAAAVGTTFWAASLRVLAGDGGEGVDATLDGLVSRGLVGRGTTPRLSGEDPLIFSHPLLREVTYENTLKETRADAHFGFAAWLEGAVGERIAEWEEMIGHHYARAHDYFAELGSGGGRPEAAREIAVRRLSAAGARALSREDMAAASGLLERALSLLDEGRPERPEISVKLSIALAGTGEISRAGALVTDHIESQIAGKTHLAYRDEAGHPHTVDLSSADGPVRVGRRSVNELALGWDPETSRQHAVFERGADGVWTVFDSRSRNGTFVNGERIEDRRPLRDGDVIRVGRTVLAFRQPHEGGPTLADESAATVLPGSATAKEQAESMDSGSTEPPTLEDHR
jgi:class 3 adenylate cyclase